MSQLKNLNKLLEQYNIASNHEVTWHKGNYWLLYIAKNNNPVPLFYSKDPKEIENQIELYKEV